MRRLTLIAATVAALAAVPATAQTQAVIVAGATQSLAADTTSCQRNVGSKTCRDYQDRLIQSVGRTAAARNRNMSVNELGRQQLDALVASIN